MAELGDKPDNIGEKARDLSRRDLLKMGWRHGKTAAGAIAVRKLLPPVILTGVLGHVESHDRFNDPAYELPPFPDFQTPERDQRVLVIPLVGRDKQKPESTTHLETMLENVRQSYAGNSYDKLQYQFTVLPWNVIDMPTGGDVNKKLADIGDALAARSDIEDLSQFQTRLYVSHSDLFSGGFGGKRQPATYNQAWIYKSPEKLDFEGEEYGFMASVTKHELGHTLGMPHANSIDANGVKKEYGGESDTMGQASSIGIEFNAPQRVSMGWIEKEQVRSITEDGVYILNPTSITPPGLEQIIRVLRIQKPDTNERYYVSLRAQGAAFGDIDIHQWNERVDTAPNEVLTPATNREYGWKEGDEFYDAKNGIRIKMVSKKSFFLRTPDAGEVQLQITFDKK